MRRASPQIIVAIATVIVTGAAAIAANPDAKVLLRSSAASAAAPAHAAPTAMLRTNSGRVAAVKAAKPAHHKLAARAASVRRHAAVHKTAPSISVPLDEVRVVAFSQPISTVYVGNPMIADVSMIDSRHAFVLGKGFGHTNIVALDADGKQLVNDPVTVFGHAGSTVVLHRGTAQATYACAGARCEAAPTPGDDKDSFQQRMEQIEKHQDDGVKAASAR